MRPAPTLWAEEAPPPNWTPLDHDARCDVLVIGAGLAGLAVASELKRRGADVMVVDADAPGAGASARNAGFVLVAHVWDYPELRARHGAETCRAMIAIARRTHARIAERFGHMARHRRAGSWMLPIAGDAHETGVLVRAAALLREDGVETIACEPPPALAGFGPGLIVPEDGEVHPGALVAALARDVARGAIARIDELSPRHARAGAHTITFDRAIIATNALSRRLLPELEAIVTPHRAQVLAIAPLAERVLDRPVYACFGYDYFRQRDDGSILLGGRRHLHREAEATDATETSPAVQRDLEVFLARHLPFAAGAPIVRRWAGTMAFTPDALPLVGPLPRAPESISLLCGWNGHGLGLAIGAAELLAESLEGNRDAIPRALDPSRFATMLAPR